MFVRKQNRRGSNRLENLQNKPRPFSKASTTLVAFDPLSPDGPSGISSEPATEPTDLTVDNSQIQASEQLRINVSQKRRSLPVKFVSSSQRKKPEKAFRKSGLFGFLILSFFMDRIRPGLRLLSDDSNPRGLLTRSQGTGSFNLQNFIFFGLKRLILIPKKMV